MRHRTSYDLLEQPHEELPSLSIVVKVYSIVRTYLRTSIASTSIAPTHDPPPKKYNTKVVTGVFLAVSLVLLLLLLFSA